MNESALAGGDCGIGFALRPGMRIVCSVALTTFLASGCASIGPDATLDDQADAGPTSDQPGGDDGDECASGRLAVAPVVPTVMVLIDRSGTMVQGFGGTDRWRAVYQTLMGQGGVITSLQDRVRFGAALYTSINGFGGNQGADGQPAGTCPMLAAVAPALDNAAAIDAMYAPRAPIEDTPTGAALRAMITELEKVDAPGPKAVIVATDGEPDTCTQPDPDGTPEGRAEAISAAEDAFAAGVETYIISVGNGVAEEHLQDMANAGVGLQVGGAQNAPYYRAFDTDQLVAAFDDIITGVQGCQLALDGQVDPARAEDGTVTLDGRELAHGSEWQIVDESTIELLGAACDTLTDGGEHVVEAEFACGIIID